MRERERERKSQVNDTIIDYGGIRLQREIIKWWCFLGICVMLMGVSEKQKKWQLNRTGH